MSPQLQYDEREYDERYIKESIIYYKRTMVVDNDKRCSAAS
jgi:hypothetical protein